MTSTRDFFTFLTYSSLVMVFHCKADRPPSPTGLTYKWLDAFTVNVSWKKPSALPDGCDVKYKYYLMKNGIKNDLGCTLHTSFTKTCLTEEMGSDRWTYIISTICNKSCDSLTESTHVPVEIISRRAEVVKDFKCFIYPDKRNCSWIPVNQSRNLTLSYRICGHSDEHIKGLKVCDQPYSSGTRTGCVLKVADEDDVCISVDTEAGMSTFKPVLVVPSPQLTISQDGENLKLNWTLPPIETSCRWIYEVHYNKCNEPKEMKNFTILEKPHTHTMPYDNRCLYEFQSRVMTDEKCKEIFSDFSKVVTYGTNEPPDRTLAVVAIVVPIILSICIILSCYCFRRHSAIICPIIPDPSAIFKEMMMNGNKDPKTPIGRLYTPVPEPIEPCKITLVTENTVLQQNS